MQPPTPDSQPASAAEATQPIARDAANTPAAAAAVSAITVGMNPFGVACGRNPRGAAGSRVYVANSSPNPITNTYTLSIIDTVTGAVTAVPVGISPWGVAVSPDGATVYVTNAGANTVSVVDVKATPPAVIATIQVGSNPEGVAVHPNGQRLFVANSGSGTVTVIDTTTNKVIGLPLTVGKGPAGVAVTPDGRRLYVANAGSGADLGTTVSLIDLASGAVQAITVGAGPFAVAVTPNGALAYVTNNQEGTISRIANYSATPSVLGTPIPTGSRPTGIAITPDSRTAYVANTGSNTVTPLDTADGFVAPAISIDKAPFWLAVTPDGSGLYVSQSDTSTASVVPLPHVDVMSTWNTDGNTGTNPGYNFLGTRDNQPLIIKTNDVESVQIQPRTDGGTGGVVTVDSDGSVLVPGRVGTRDEQPLTLVANTATVMELVGNKENELRSAMSINGEVGILGDLPKNYIFTVQNGNTGAFFGPPPGRESKIFGDLHVTGKVRQDGGGFQLDHPDDPARRYLGHSFVESDEMKNVYDGMVELDSAGAAVVELPGWFGAVNDHFRYQLTAIGGPAPSLHIAEEIDGNRFMIGGGSAGMKVSWQVTGIRKDRWACANRIEVESDKPEEEQGYFLHPELYGHGGERHVARVRFPGAQPGEAAREPR